MSNTVVDPEAQGRLRTRATRSRSGYLPVVLIIVASALIAALVAFGVRAAMPVPHRAQADLLVAVPAVSVLNDQNVATQLTLLTGRSVLGPVAEERDMDVARLTDSVSADRVGDSQILALVVEADDADEALELAEAVVAQYLSTVTETTSSSVEADYLEQRIAEATERLAQLDVRISLGAGSSLGTERDIVLAEVTELQGELTSAEVRELQSAAPATVVTEPYSVMSTGAPTPLQAAVGAALAGALLAAGLLWARRLLPGPSST